MSESKSYRYYDSAGMPYNLSPRQVSALVNKRGLEKRRIYGQMAVESSAWDAVMLEMNLPLAPGFKPKEKP